MPKVSIFVSAIALLVGTVHGVVMRGPITPVCRVGTPCEAPAARLALVFSRTGTQTRVRITTDAHGRYRLRARAGTYTVSTAKPPAIGRGLEPETVRVRAGRDVRADFHLDTGIR